MPGAAVYVDPAGQSTVVLIEVGTHEHDAVGTTSRHNDDVPRSEDGADDEAVSVGMSDEMVDLQSSAAEPEGEAAQAHAPAATGAAVNSKGVALTQAQDDASACHEAE